MMPQAREDGEGVVFPAGNNVLCGEGAEVQLTLSDLTAWASSDGPRL